ncbi:MAG: integrase arm-type DNA-binding domain-containing protein [Betaproteobacteria bacterium]|nr:integrase arm-type DNA-binding domain-containing protein [Betaproteobacteria bacterium]
MAEGKLTAMQVNKLTKPGHHGDGGGLYLRVREDRKVWFFRYKVAGKSHWLGLGPYPDYPLAEAREAARQCRRQLREGIDPLEARRAAKDAAQAATETTFKAVAQAYIAAHKDTWRNPKHAAQWPATLEAYVYPRFGDKPVHAVSVADVLAVLEPIWRVIPETASRVRGRIEIVLDYAAARHLRTGENPARWRGHLQHTLPKREKVAKVEHHAATPWADLPALYAKLTESNGMAAMCLRFLILNATRSGEARGATWAEIDINKKLWTIPGDRMKAGREHRIPLSAPAVALLEEMAQLGTEPARLVFPGQVKGKPLSDVALNKALATAGGGKHTVHGMRSTFRDWCAERTTYPREVAETALAHTNKDKVEAAYLRGDHFEQRRRLMDDWATYTTVPAAPAGQVVNIGKVRA